MTKTNTYKNKERIAIFLTSTTLAVLIFLAFGALIVILWNGLGLYWQKPMYLYELNDGSKYIGTEFKKEIDSEKQSTTQIKIANKDIFDTDYVWIIDEQIKQRTKPENTILMERYSEGNIHGVIKTTNDSFENITEKLFNDWEKTKVIQKTIDDLTEESNRFNRLAYENNQKIIELDFETNNSNYSEKNNLQLQNETYFIEINRITNDIRQNIIEQEKYTFNIYDANENSHTIRLNQVIKILFPNQMSLKDKIINYLDHLWILLSEEPREANTEGGIFPAIFGTICMIFLMSILSFPLGVITAIYLQEYAKKGWLLNTVRIAVNNLAGVPSIVYGIFGLSFFIYGIGGMIDQIFYPQHLPTPTFGSGNILWASMTLGILTAPVVIVSTEEALSAIPLGVRQASLALGATKFQTVFKVVFPLAIPGMLTGFILAMARAAGEVAPLMITGVVKLAPSLPIDGNFPYIHLNRKFMHIGFHIFDVGFQSPNVEASKAMVYMSTLLLLVIVLLLTGTAIYIRNKMSRRLQVF